MSIWDATIEFANRVYTFAYIALVIGATLTAIATMSLFWASALRDKFADTQIERARENAAEANERAGALETQAAELKEQAAEAQSSAERARADQARLQVDLAREQTERIRFEGQFAWRTVS